MSKSFYTTGTGSQQTLTNVQDEKIPIYDSLSDAEADLANLEENQIVATKDEGVGELLHTVDTVQAGNMHPVTSNAVAEAIKYKDDWVLGQVIETDQFFEGNRLKHYYSQTFGATGNQYVFSLPERPTNIIDISVSATDNSNNILQDGYIDIAGGYTLRAAYISSNNTIVVAWTGWTTLNALNLFVTYR